MSKPPLPTIANSPLSAPSASVTPSQPFAVSVQLPPERHDYLGDVVSGGIGLMGALIGAWAAAKWGRKAALDARALDVKDRDDASLEALGLKIGKIYSAQLAFRDSYRAAQERLGQRRMVADANPIPGRIYVSHLAMEMQALANIPDRVSFTTEELSCAGRKVGYQAANTLIVLDDQHNATLELQSLYRERRTIFVGKVSAEGDFDGALLSHQWVEAEYRKHRVSLAELDSLADAIGTHSAEDTLAAFEALKRITQAQIDEHPEREGAEITTPDRQKIVIRPRATPPTT